MILKFWNTNEFQSKLSYLKKQRIENDIKNDKEIIDRISYSEIGDRIIKFFSLSQPENKRKEYIEKNVSPTNIYVINSYIKENLSNYYQFIENKGIDLLNILKEIKEERKSYKSLVQDRQKELNTYIEFLSKRDKNLANKISFIFNNSKYLLDYVFQNNNKIDEKDIFNEFVQKEAELKKKNAKSK